MTTTRRSLLIGLLAAPAIVKLDRLMIMPRRPWPPVVRRPGGLLLCNGASLSAREYPDLFAIIGNTYGGSSGDGFFRLPDHSPVEVLDQHSNATPVHLVINPGVPGLGPPGMILFAT